MQKSPKQLPAAAFMADNSEAFCAKVRAEIQGWMKGFLCEPGLLYMQHKITNGQSVRKYFLKALQATLKTLRPVGAEGLASGSWLLPCGLTAMEVYSFVSDAYDERGVVLDKASIAASAEMVPNWDGACVQRIHAQRVRPPKIVARKPKKAPKPKAAKVQNVRQLAQSVVKAPTCKRKVYIAWWENTLQMEEKRAARNPRQTATARRLAAEQPHVLTSKQEARRAQLKAKALAAAEARGHCVAVGALDLDALGQPMQKALVRRARKRDTEGNVVCDKRGNPVWEPQLLLVASGSSDVYVSCTEVDTRTVTNPEVLLEPKSDVPMPWIEKPETRPASPKSVNRRMEKASKGKGISSDKHSSRKAAAEMAAAKTASAEDAFSLQDTEARRKVRDQEWYQQWCQQNAALLAEFGIAA